MLYGHDGELWTPVLLQSSPLMFEEAQSWRIDRP